MSVALREPIYGLPGDASVVVNGSIGVSLYPRDGADAHSVVAAADQDMHRRKAGCRG